MQPRVCSLGRVPIPPFLYPAHGIAWTSGALQCGVPERGLLAVRVDPLVRLLRHEQRHVVAELDLGRRMP